MRASVLNTVTTSGYLTDHGGSGGAHLYDPLPHMSIDGMS
jgi:hypothetical protein